MQQFLMHLHLAPERQACAGIADDRFQHLTLCLLCFAQKQHGDAIIAGRR